MTLSYVTFYPLIYVKLM